jgi:hypothetical protein
MAAELARLGLRASFAPARNERSHASHAARPHGGAWKQPLRQVRRNWADAVGPHHLAVLMLDDVAVPDIEARQIELRLHAGDLARVGDDRVFKPRSEGSGPRALPLNGCRSTTWNCTS